MPAAEMPEFERNDQGKGSFNQYRGVLVPANGRVRIRLAGSNPHQALLAELSGQDAETAISRRSQQLEAVDAPIEVRLFVGARVVGPVGWVPWGLESVVDEALGRLDTLGRKTRIPVEIIRKGGLYRVELLMGRTRP
ncbi:MAG TPA: hypothetical protein VN200_03475 [Rhodoglobus sp.]|nr:hypothetical protein [Rhodoglobus sp.]